MRTFRTGYCQTYYGAWLRWREKVDSADHRVFEVERRAQVYLPPRRRGSGDQAIRDTDSPYVR
jgi:hypothetical protein